MTATYTVRSGDTLSGIAQKNGATVSGLMELNPEIQTPDRIFAGQDLTMPASDGEEFSSAPATCVASKTPCEEEYVEIVHVTGKDELYFLTEEDIDELLTEETRVGSGIEQLYRGLDEKQCFPAEDVEHSEPQDAEGALRTDLQQQKQALVEDLQALGVVSTDMQTTPKLTEIKRLKGNKHFTYVRSDKIKSHWRSYKIDSKDRDRSEGWLTPDGLDAGKMREAIESDFGIRFNVSFWELDPDSNFSKSMNQFYDEVKWSVWGDEQQEQQNLDETGFNASAEAQFMRFASGVGASGEFTPSEGKVHLQAQAQAQFSLAEGKATIEQAYPANNDSEIRVYYRRGGFNGPLVYQNMGHFQARLSITASGYAGASALIAGNVKVDCSEGVPTIKGITSAPDDSDEGMNATAEAFAGVRAGCELLGGLYWVDKLTRQSDWKTLCQVGQKVEGAAGVGAEAYLKLAFNAQTGKFFLRAHAGLVFGLGASGTFVLDVNADELASMMRFVYNSLLKADIRYLELFDGRTDAFSQYIRLSLLALVRGVDYAVAASEIVSSGIDAVEETITRYIRLHEEGEEREEKGLELAKNLLLDISKREDSVIRHSSPEIKGPILDKLTYDYDRTFQLTDGTFTKVQAVGKIMETFQSWRDFEETMLRMNSSGLVTPGVCEVNAQKVFRFIGLNQHYYRLYKKTLEGKVAIPDRPVELDPFGACRNCGINN